MVVGSKLTMTISMRCMSTFQVSNSFPAVAGFIPLCSFLSSLMNLIPGLCKVWATRREGPEAGHWVDMPYGPRSYDDCESIIDYYKGEWGNFYSYRILSAADTSLRSS